MDEQVKDVVQQLALLQFKYKELTHCVNDIAESVMTKQLFDQLSGSVREVLLDNKQHIDAWLDAYSQCSHYNTSDFRDWITQLFKSLFLNMSSTTKILDVKLKHSHNNKYTISKYGFGIVYVPVLNSTKRNNSKPIDELSTILDLVSQRNEIVQELATIRNMKNKIDMFNMFCDLMPQLLITNNSLMQLNDSSVDKRYTSFGRHLNFIMVPLNKPILGFTASSDDPARRLREFKELLLVDDDLYYADYYSFSLRSKFVDFDKLSSSSLNEHIKHALIILQLSSELPHILQSSTEQIKQLTFDLASLQRRCNDAFKTHLTLMSL